MNSVTTALGTEGLLILWEFVSASLSSWEKSWVTYHVLQRGGMNFGKFSDPYVKVPL